MNKKQMNMKKNNNKYGFTYVVGDNYNKEDYKNKSEDRIEKEYVESVCESDKELVYEDKKFISKILPSKFITNIVTDSKVISKNNGITVSTERIKFDAPFVIQSKLLYRITPKLSNTAKDLIYYICNHMEWNINTISFNFEDFTKEYNCSKKYFYAAINELVSHNIIEKYYNRNKVYSVNFKYIIFGNFSKFIGIYNKRFKKGLIIKDGLVDIPDRIYKKYLDAIKQDTNNENINDENNEMNEIEDVTKTITDEQLEVMEELLG